MNKPVQLEIKLDRDFIPVLVICKNEGNLKKIEAARVMTSDDRDFLPLLVTGKIEVDLKKTEVAIVMTTFSRC